jgi:hypothetical protein
MTWWEYELLAIVGGAAAAILILWILLGVQVLQRRRDRARAPVVPIDEARRQELKALVAADYAKFTAKRKHGGVH